MLTVQSASWSSLQHWQLAAACSWKCRTRTWPYSTASSASSQGAMWQDWRPLGGDQEHPWNLTTKVKTWRWAWIISQAACLWDPFPMLRWIHRTCEFSFRFRSATTSTCSPRVRSQLIARSRGRAWTWIRRRSWQRARCSTTHTDAVKRRIFTKLKTAKNMEFLTLEKALSTSKFCISDPVKGSQALPMHVEFQAVASCSLSLRWAWEASCTRGSHSA
jgi:hypothetical protein